MKAFKTIFFVTAFVCIAGFITLSLIDMRPPQSQIIQTIPNERFFQS